MIWWKRCCRITEDIKVTSNSYVIDGKEYVRVTRCLDIIAKPEFYRWFGKHGYEWCTNYRDDRAAFGTRVHKEIQNFLEDENVWLDNNEMSQVFNNFKEWYNSHDIKPVALEKHLRSDRLMTAGTCDFVGYIDGVPSVLDWKTSKKVYDNYPVQVATYLSMYNSCLDRDFLAEQAGVVCFTKDGVVEKYFDIDECKRLAKVFEHARALYRWKYGK